LNWLKRLYRYLLNRLERRYSNRYYKSIEDLPVYNWWKIHEENDFKWLLSNPNKKVNRYADKIFKSIKSQFVDEFGIDKRYAKYLDALVKKTLLEIKMVKTKDKSSKIFIDLLETEIIDFLTEDEKKSVSDKGFSIVSKYVGGSIKIKEITVWEFYHHIKAIERQVNNGIR
jgi:transcriptional regulator CtsR